MEALRGEPVEPVFRRTSNFHVKPKGTTATATSVAVAGEASHGGR
jgi:hypothetical protein